jgi:hypothetical protein
MQVTRWVSDEPQPGIIECQLVDASGRVWTFTEKDIVTEDRDEAVVAYPRPCEIPCKELGRARCPDGREMVRIKLESWFGYEEEARGEFEVYAEQLVSRV